MHATWHANARRLHDEEGGGDAAGGAVLVNKGHLKTGGCAAEIAGLDEDLECIKDDHMYMIVFYILGILYMFLGLAIVCDEFFVPALEFFVDEFNISMDVAGATFMAAGGSAPELFTSMIGTFNESEVGIGTIVGSAVFNVLFVIGVCAIASTEVLSLTWWPLFRDCTYYILCLILLSVFIGINSPEEIELWEALVLLFLYIGYVVLMKFNVTLENMINRSLGKECAIEPSQKDDEKVDSLFVKPSTFRTGIVQLLCQKDEIIETAGVLAVSKVVGNVRETFDQFDKDKSGSVDIGELGELLSQLGCDIHGKHANNLQLAMQAINRTGNGMITFEEFSRWYVGSEARIEVKMQKIFDKFDTNGDGLIDRNEVASLLGSLGHSMKDNDVDALIKEIKNAAAEEPAPRTSTSGCTASCGILMEQELKTVGLPIPVEPDQNTTPKQGDGPPAPAYSKTVSPEGGPEVLKTVTDDTPQDDKIRLEEFAIWYRKSMFYQAKLHTYEVEHKAGNQGFSIDMPDDAGTRGVFWYNLTYPICAALYVTLPDVRKEGRGTVKWATCGFFGSIMWIGFFSYCMVDWTTIMSNTIGIPVPVAGLTILAAGTSVPDLLSSYIVARQGQGDMAVSSSIGSNIFDVTVGLPLPWTLYNIVNGKSVGPIKAKSLGFSIMVLVGMLVIVIVTVKLCKWQMTKSMGYGMFVFYLVFLIQELLQQFPTDKPIISTPEFR